MKPSAMESDGSDEVTAKCRPKTQDQLHGSCDRNSFQCDNGECINIDAMCGNLPNFQSIFYNFHYYSVSRPNILM